MNVNKYVAAVGGVAVGVGSTLLAQKLRKDARESGLLDAIEETVNDAKETIAEAKTEQTNAIKYREEAVKQNTSSRPVAANTPTKKTARLSATLPESD